MNKRAKRGVVLVLILVVFGLLFVGVMTYLQWDFTKLSTVKYDTQEHKIYAPFDNISVVTNTADVTFVPSPNEESTVTCFEQQKVKHTVVVKDGTLCIEVTDTRKWYEHIGLDFHTPKITVFIPRGKCGALSVKGSTGDVEIPSDFIFESIDLSQSTGNVISDASAVGAMKIRTSTGDIRLQNLSAGSLSLSVSTGKIAVSDATCRDQAEITVSTGRAELTDITCRELLSDGDTGDLTLRNVVATDKFTLERDTGDIRLEDCDASELWMKTDTGDITGTLLSDKVFLTETDTGKISVPKTVTGGRCEITTDTGDIDIIIQK